jgi:hypothetical protein
MDQPNALARVEAELGQVRGRQGRRVLEGWARRCPMLGRAAVSAPGEVPSWVWTLDRHHADVVLRNLVDLAQAGDQHAVLAVLACLRPGLCSLVTSLRVGMDEVMSEAGLVILTLPRTRRRRIAANLLLDVRHRVWERQRRAAREVPLGDSRDVAEMGINPGGVKLGRSSAGQVADIVLSAWRAGYLAEDPARLILETRVYGDTAVAAAARRGISPKAACERRRRAEARLARWCALPSSEQRHRSVPRSLHGGSGSATTYLADHHRTRQGASGRNASRSGS